MADDSDVPACGSGSAEGLRDGEGTGSQDEGMSGGRVCSDGGSGAEPSGGQLPVREASAEPDYSALPSVVTVALTYSKFIAQPGAFYVSLSGPDAATVFESLASALRDSFAKR